MTKPAIIITIGKLAFEAVQQIKPVYLQAGENRPLLTSFLCLDDKNKLIESAQINKPLQTSSNQVNTRQQFSEILNNNDPILNVLQNKFASLCADDNLIQAGFTQINEISINLYIVADLTDSFEAARTLAMILILQKWLEFDNRINVFLELNLALFENNNETKLKLQANVKDLGEILDPRSTQRKNLLRQLGASGDYFNGLPVIFLDRVKSNGTFVSDINELKIMMGNALYALLQEDFSTQIEFFHDGPFASLGCSLLLLDPKDLMIFCAKKCGTDFIQQQLLSPENNNPQRVSMIEILINKLGSLDGWIQEALSKLPPPITIASAQSEAMSASLKLGDYNPPSLNYMNLPGSTWVEYANNYLNEFEKIQLKFLRKHLVEYFDTFKEDKIELLDELGNSLITNSLLYPGGIKNSIVVMENAHLHLEEFSSKINRYLKRAGEAIKTQLLEFNSLSLKTAELFSQAPKPPFFIKWLPKQIAEWFCLFYIPWRYKLKILTLRNSMNDTVTMLESICNLRIQEKILLLIKEIPAPLMQNIDSIIKDYNALYKTADSKIDEVKSEFTTTSQDERHDIFRQSMAKQEWVDFGIQKWPVNNQEWLEKFLETPEFKQNWRKLKDDFIPRWVFAEGLSHYKIWMNDANLGTLFNNVIEKKGKKGLSGLLSPIKAGRTPLLNPSFNATGLVESHKIQEFLLAENPERVSSISEDADIYTDKLIITLDPYTFGFICLESGIPLKALPLFRFETDQLEKLWQKYSLILADEKTSPNLLAGPNVIVSDVEGSDGDLIQKTFRWVFQPKGKPEPIEQEITIKISKERFQQYKSKQRFNRSFNLYSEEEMPEIRELALAFQEIHSAHKWSTFNQAFNILTFVQSCIPYSFDKDTTPSSDWARYPIETLMDCTGDCEDVAILCGAILARLGFSSALFAYPGHVAFGVQAADSLKGDYVEDPISKKKYYYGEATAKGWRLGEIPAEYKNTPPNGIYPITLVVTE